MWLGPPYMNRKMTLLAFAAKCGFFGASGLTNAAGRGGAAARAAKNPSSSSPARATPVKPAPASQRNSRRVRPQKSRLALPIGPLRLGFRSIEVDELVQVQPQQAEVAQGLVGRQAVRVAQAGDERQAALDL